MIRFITLGTTDVQGAILPVPAGRPLAALVFLSLQHEPVRRSELVDILWDVGVVRAERHSLSQLLYGLKRCLPPTYYGRAGVIGHELAG